MTLGRKLTFKYGVALAAIALVVSCSYVLLVTAIDENREDVYVINISGQQRMLSQRIAFLAHLIGNASPRHDLQKKAVLLDQSIGQMLSNHEQLISGDLANGETHPLTDAITEAYFGERNLDTRIRDYIAKARQLHEVFIEKGVSQELGDVAYKLDQKALWDILKDLDAVVSVYEGESRARIESFRMMETTMIIAVMLLLLVEVITIFRPMVRDIVEKSNALKSSNEQLSTFSYRLLNDIRAPLSTCMSHMELIQKHTANDGGGLKKLVSMTKQNITDIQSMVDDMGHVLKMKTIESVPKDVELKHMIKALAEAYKDEKVELRLQLQAMEPVHTHEAFLKQLLSQLISNGFKYADHSKEAPYVEITAAEAGGEVTVTVSDNGLGIPEEKREELFEMFSRFHSDSNVGSGLGLYIAQQSAHEIGGDVSYVPLEQGSQFTVTFPAKLSA